MTIKKEILLRSSSCGGQDFGELSRAAANEHELGTSIRVFVIKES